MRLQWPLLTVDLSPCFPSPSGEGSVATLSLRDPLSLPIPARPSSGGRLVGGGVPNDDRVLATGDDTSPLETAAGKVSQMFPAPAQDKSDSWWSRGEDAVLAPLPLEEARGDELEGEGLSK